MQNSKYIQMILYCTAPFLAAIIAMRVNVVYRETYILVVGFVVLSTWFNRPIARLFANTKFAWLLISISGFLICAFFSLGTLFFYNFSNFDSGDTACYISSFLHPHGFIPGTNTLWGEELLSMHSEFWIIPVSLIFRIFPRAWFLLSIQFLCILSSAVIFYFWIRKECNGIIAAWLSLAYCCSPFVIVPLLNGYHGVTTAFPALILSGITFYRKKFRLFIASIIILLLSKEIFILSCIGLSVTAVVLRRSRRWWLTPLLIGIGYASILKFAYFPIMREGGGYYYSFFINDPRSIMASFRSEATVKYVLVCLLTGGLIIALRSPYTLCALPALLLNIALGGRFLNPRLHYVIEPAFWIFFGAVVFLLGQKNRSFFIHKIVSFTATILLVAVPFFHGLPLYKKHIHAKSYKKALSHIPPNAEIMLAAPLASHLGNCDKLGWAIYTKPQKYDSIISGMSHAVVQLNNTPKWCVNSEFNKVKILLQKISPDCCVWKDSTMAVFFLKQKVR